MMISIVTIFSSVPYLSEFMNTHRACCSETARRWDPVPRSRRPKPRVAGGASAPPAVPDTAIYAVQGYFPISWLLILSLLLYLQKALHGFYTLDLTNI